MHCQLEGEFQSCWMATSTSWVPLFSSPIHFPSSPHSTPSSLTHLHQPLHWHSTIPLLRNSPFPLCRTLLQPLQHLICYTPPPTADCGHKALEDQYGTNSTGCTYLYGMFAMASTSAVAAVPVLVIVVIALQHFY